MQLLFSVLDSLLVYTYSVLSVSAICFALTRRVMSDYGKLSSLLKLYLDRASVYENCFM